LTDRMDFEKFTGAVNCDTHVESNDSFMQRSLAEKIERKVSAQRLQKTASECVLKLYGKIQRRKLTSSRAGEIAGMIDRSRSEGIGLVEDNINRAKEKKQSKAKEVYESKFYNGEVLGEFILKELRESRTLVEALKDAGMGDDKCNAMDERVLYESTAGMLVMLFKYLMKDRG
ncbi:MAG TPA: hypothetical protein P5315_11775, partial [Clostridia bacterium]|nr:hypothetical protein [Clostridia bacterium]